MFFRIVTNILEVCFNRIKSVLLYVNTLIIHCLFYIKNLQKYYLRYDTVSNVIICALKILQKYFANY